MAKHLQVGMFLLFAAGQAMAAESGRGLLSRADHLAWRGNWIKARPLYEEAERDSRQNGNEKATIKARIGCIRSQMQCSPSAKLFAEMNHELVNPLVAVDPELKIRALAFKGEIAHQCDLWAAREAWDQVLDLATKTGDEAWEGRAMGELGVLAYVVEGDSTRATLLIGKALFKAAKAQDSWGEATYLTHLANALSLLGRHEIALKYFQKALTAARTQPDSPFPLAVYIGKARTLLETRKYAQSQVLVDEALQQARFMQYQISETELLILRAKLAITKADSTSASGSLKQAIHLATQGGYGRALAEAESELASLYKEQGDFLAAEEHLKRSLSTMKAIGDSCNLPQRLKDLAALKIGRGNLAEASAVYDEITDITEGLIASSNTEYAKATLVSSLSEVFLDHFILLADQLNDSRKAFVVLERARGRSLSDRLQADVPLDEETRRDKLPIYHEISSLNRNLLQTSSPSERAQLLSAITATEQKLAPVIAQHNLYRKAIAGRPVPLEQLQRTLRNDELLLEYVLIEPLSFCLAISGSSVNLIHLPSKSQIDTVADQYLRGVRARISGTPERKELFNLLLSPSGIEGFSRIIIVPDGNLHLLPFDSFISKNEKSVVESHVVSYAPSATSFYLLRTLPVTNEPRRTLLAVGGIPAAQKPKQPKQYASRSLFTLEAKKIDVLAQTSAEIQSIGRLFPGETTLLDGKKATEDALKSLPLEEFRILHFAVHGFSDTNNPERAALLLAIDGDSVEDGLLQDREIRDLHLAADLVTLSSCDTGIGQLQGQEGISNLVRSFFLAGARTVVASLWNADDIATTSLMKHFYSYLEKGEDKASALRLAKLDLLHQFGQDALPYYWAGFTLHGDSNGSIFLVP